MKQMPSLNSIIFYAQTNGDGNCSTQIWHQWARKKTIYSFFYVSVKCSMQSMMMDSTAGLTQSDLYFRKANATQFTMLIHHVYSA